MRTPCLAALTALLLVTVPQTATGQDSPVNVLALQRLLQPGDTLIVTAADGRVTRSVVRDSSIEPIIQRLASPAARIDRIAAERRDSVWNGALIGLAVAGAPWLIACAANDWCYYNEYGSEQLLRRTALTTAAIGAGLGALFDLSRPTRFTVYQATANSSTSVGISPAVSPSGVAVRLVARF